MRAGLTRAVAAIVLAAVFSAVATVPGDAAHPLKLRGGKHGAPMVVNVLTADDGVTELTADDGVTLLTAQ